MAPPPQHPTARPQASRRRNDMVITTTAERTSTSTGHRRSTLETAARRQAMSHTRNSSSSSADSQELLTPADAVASPQTIIFRGVSLFDETYSPAFALNTPTPRAHTFPATPRTPRQRTFSGTLPRKDSLEELRTRAGPRSGYFRHPRRARTASNCSAYSTTSCSSYGDEVAPSLADEDDADTAASAPSHQLDEENDSAGAHDDHESAYCVPVDIKTYVGDASSGVTAPVDGAESASPVRSGPSFARASRALAPPVGIVAGVAGAAGAAGAGAAPVGAVGPAAGAPAPGGSLFSKLRPAVSFSALRIGRPRIEIQEWPVWERGQDPTKLPLFVQRRNREDADPTALTAPAPAVAAEASRAPQGKLLQTVKSMLKRPARRVAVDEDEEPDMVCCGQREVHWGIVDEQEVHEGDV